MSVKYCPHWSLLIVTLLAINFINCTTKYYRDPNVNITFQDALSSTIRHNPYFSTRDQPMKRFAKPDNGRYSKLNQDDDQRLLVDVYTLEEDKLREDDSRPIIVNDFRVKQSEDMIDSVVPDSIGTVDDEDQNADVTFVRRSQWSDSDDNHHEPIARVNLIRSEDDDGVVLYAPTTERDNRAGTFDDGTDSLVKFGYDVPSPDSVEELFVNPNVAGHKMMQGGAGEGQQYLGPDGLTHNVQVIKSDKGLDEYCSPVNPCPLGFTAKDGCLSEFENTAAFSRDYQAQQDCPCDVEHSLGNCQTPMKGSEYLDALARAVQNRIGSMGLPDIKKRMWT